VKRRLTEKLRAGCPGTEFLPAVAYTADDARKILEADAEVDGYLAYMIGGWAGAAEATAAARRRGWKVASVTSSRFEDVIAAVRLFECLKKMRSSTIAVVGADPGATGKAIEEVFGTRVVPVAFAEINAAYEKADRAEAKAWADRWIREAERVVEPAREEIEKSGAMYLALRAMMEANRAEAIAMNCLGGVYSGQTHAYPCLGFFQLNSDGLVGACEADIESAVTMLLMKHLAGVPGYISDPVLDTATNRVIYIHCVAPRKVFGPAGRTNPYEIRSHAEDRKGAAVRDLCALAGFKLVEEA